MWKNALFATTALLLIAVTALFPQIDCLRPYRSVLVAHWGVPAAIYAGLFSVNAFAFFFWLTRVTMLKDTGRKLAHAQKQIQSGTLATELGKRLAREE